VNYTSTLLGEGALITLGGEWQPMSLGDHYAIHSTGAWTAGTGS